MNRIFKKQFPKIADRVKSCRKKANIAETEVYGYFFNFCLNMARNNGRVHCKPHVDHKNVAIGMCVILVYGELFTST